MILYLSKGWNATKTTITVGIHWPCRKVGDDCGAVCGINEQGKLKFSEKTCPSAAQFTADPDLTRARTRSAMCEADD
jgi:hypothetical protein